MPVQENPGQTTSHTNTSDILDRLNHIIAKLDELNNLYDKILEMYMLPSEPTTENKQEVDDTQPQFFVTANMALNNIEGQLDTYLNRLQRTKV